MISQLNQLTQPHFSLQFAVVIHMITTETALQYARTYAELGWAVLPIRPPDLEEEGGGKAPLGELVPKGFKNATTDKEQIQHWWRMHPQANIGIVTGLRSGVAVVDVDPRDGGDQTLEQLQSQYERFPDTLITRTGSGGSHFWFRCPADGLGTSKLAQGIDLKVDGGYVVTPPSMHASGDIYDFAARNWTDQLPLPALPQWIVDLVGQQKTGRDSDPSPSRPRRTDVDPTALPYDPLRIYEERLRASTLKLIETGVVPRRYRSPSERDFATIIRLHHAGLAPEEIKHVYFNYPIGASLAQRHMVHDYLDRTIRKAYPPRLVRDRHLPQTIEILREIKRTNSDYRRRKTVPLSRSRHKALLQEREAIDEQTFRLLLKFLRAEGVRWERSGQQATYHLPKVEDLNDRLRSGTRPNFGDLCLADP